MQLEGEDRRLAVIRRLIDKFDQLLSRTAIPQSDMDREAIRSAGVNVFVEFEGFVEELIAYLVWMLSSDHPKTTRFIYSRSNAMNCVSPVLGLELQSGTETVRWSSGGNTLGTCMRYMQRLNEWMSGLSTADRSPFIRRAEEIHRQPSDSVTMFPFRHEQLWADAALGSLSQLANAISMATEPLNRVEVTSIRNGLEHYREPTRFPTTDRILSAVDGLRSFVEVSVKERLAPKLYWLAGTRNNAFGQWTLDLVDYQGNILPLHGPRIVVGLIPISQLSSSRPVLVAPGNLFAVPNAELIFEIRPSSVYSEYWKGYPARRVELVALPADGEIEVAREPAEEPMPT